MYGLQLRFLFVQRRDEKEFSDAEEEGHGNHAEQVVDHRSVLDDDLPGHGEQKHLYHRIQIVPAEHFQKLNPYDYIEHECEKGDEGAAVHQHEDLAGDTQKGDNQADDNAYGGDNLKIKGRAEDEKLRPPDAAFQYFFYYGSHP